MSVIRELIAKFGIDVDAKGAKRAEGLIAGLVKKADVLGAAVASAFAFKGAADFIKGQIDAGSAIHDTAIKLGVTNQELQKFQYAGTLAGVSAEEMGHALGFMNKNAGLAATGNEEAAKTFASFGINLKGTNGQVRSASDLTLDFADKIAGMGSQAERTAAITKVMGRAGAQLLPAFEDGAAGIRKAFEEFQDLGGGLSDDFIDKADEAGDQIDRLKFAFGALKSRIAGAVLPTLTKVTTWFTKAVAHITRFTDKTNVAAVAFKVLGSAGLLAGLYKIAKALGLADMGLGAFLKNLFKFGPIAILVGLLFLAIEDLYTLATGGDSLIGRLLGGEKSEALIADLRKAFDDMKPAIESLMPILVDLGSTLLKAFVDALPYIVETLKVVLQGISAAIQLFAGGIKAANAALHGDWEGAGKAIDKAGDAVFGKNGVFAGAFDGFGGNTSSKLSDTPAFQRAAEIPRSQAASTKADSVQVSHQDRYEINVTGVVTNAETGRAVAGAITNAQRDKQDTLAAVRSVAPAGG